MRPAWGVLVGIVAALAVAAPVGATFFAQDPASTNVVIAQSATAEADVESLPDTAAAAEPEVASDAPLTKELLILVGVAIVAFVVSFRWPRRPSGCDAD